MDSERLNITIGEARAIFASVEIRSSYMDGRATSTEWAANEAAGLRIAATLEKRGHTHIVIVPYWLVRPDEKRIEGIGPIYRDV